LSKSFPRQGPTDGSPADPGPGKKRKTLYALIKPSKRETLHVLGSFTIAFFSVAAVLDVMARVIVSGGVA